MDNETHYDSLEAEYAAMEAAANPEPVQEAVEEPAENPTLFAGKYKSPEELEKAYKELEAKLGGEAPTKESINEEVEKSVEPVADDSAPEVPHAEIEITEELKPYETFFQEYADKGELSDESYQALAEEHNIPKDLVNAYIKNSKAAQDLKASVESQAVQHSEAQIKDVLESVGGESGFNELSEWANNNLSTSEIASIDSLLASAPPEAQKFALAGVKAKMEASLKTPARVEGTLSAPSTTKVFNSSYEIQAAMKDPRYGMDSNYTKEVERRIAVSMEKGLI